MTAIPGIIPNTDYFLEVAKGNIAGHSHINKYGRSSNADTGVPTDVWDRANPTDDQDIWIAPTSSSLYTASIKARKLLNFSKWVVLEIAEEVLRRELD